MKTVLITGATGFLGTHLVALLQRDEPDAVLRLFSRGAPVLRDASRIEIKKGSVTSAEDVQQAMEGVDEVYHLAGLVDRSPAEPWALYQTHVEGTRNVCEAAKECGVKKIVAVSSSGTVAVSHDPIERNEDSGYTNDVVAEWPYYLSKIYAEKLAFWHAEHEQLPIVVVNPSLLLGPGDERGSSTGDMALFLEGQITVVPTGGLNLVDARDAAAGTIAAMKRGRVGERYLLGGVNWTFREWIDRVSVVTGLRAPSLSVPLGSALLGARVMRRVLPLFGKQFKLDDASIKMSALYWYCDSSKARRELGFTTRDPMETLRDTVEDLYERNPALKPSHLAAREGRTPFRATAAGEG
jgi:dihydroflavonol-4-reductase